MCGGTAGDLGVLPGAGRKLCLCAYLYLALAAVVTVGGALVCRRLQAGSGAMELKGKRMRVLPKDANYALLYVTAIVTLLVLIAAVLAVPTMILFAWWPPGSLSWRCITL